MSRSVDILGPPGSLTSKKAYMSCLPDAEPHDGSKSVSRDPKFRFKIKDRVLFLEFYAEYQSLGPLILDQSLLYVSSWSPRYRMLASSWFFHPFVDHYLHLAPTSLGNISMRILFSCQCENYNCNFRKSSYISCARTLFFELDFRPSKLHGDGLISNRRLSKIFKSYSDATVFRFHVGLGQRWKVFVVRPPPHYLALSEDFGSIIQYIAIREGRTLLQAVSENSATDLLSTMMSSSQVSWGHWRKADRHTARHSTEYSSTDQPKPPTRSLNELT